ncbi:fimbria/pilus periplasmic chaperone [Klebsiella sp. RIT-PI-d]|uniref:fimbria/pilus periplasmic chaperone n=1 Tax=Klebsiella sp. RIT-PI-d TaxID=1681196 RepID=UPI002ADEADF4|nr:fimbria/pilus periplasmic chaperone [Klebsiella sp. RIT-PI-d]
MLSVIMMGTTVKAWAGGVALGATRVIYPQGDKQVSLPVNNSSASNVFLIQSWVANADGTKSADFVVTPPLFVIHPKNENVLRIMYVGPALPTDRESVFYLNSKAIPSVDKHKLQGNVLQIATQSVIKLFIRPANLPSSSVDAPAAMRCHLENGHVTLFNPSPYYISLVELYIGNVKQTNTMVPPKGSLILNAPGDGRVKFETVNDFGADTPSQTCTSR